MLSSLFDRADRLAGHDRLCFLNTDIFLTDDFLGAATRLGQIHERSLMVGRRCDLDITEPWDFSKPGWSGASVPWLANGASFDRRSGSIISYFRGDLLHQQIPPSLLAGRDMTTGSFGRFVRWVSR